MNDKKTTIAITSLIIAVIVLLFGNNIVGRLLNLSSTNEKTSDIKTNEILSENDTIQLLDFSKDSLSSNELIARELLSGKHSPDFEALLKEKRLGQALTILEIAEKNTIQTELIEQIKNEKKAVLLMMDKGFDRVYFDFPSTFVLTEKNGKKGLYTREMKELFQPKFDEIHPMFFDPLLATEINGRFGFINQDGVEIYSPVFSWIDPTYSNQLILITENNKSGFISLNGKIIIEPIFDKVARDSVKNLILVSKNSKWGLIDSLGKQVTEIQYDTIFEFNEKGIAFAKLKGKEVILNNHGKQLEISSN